MHSKKWEFTVILLEDFAATLLGVLVGTILQSKHVMLQTPLPDVVLHVQQMKFARKILDLQGSTGSPRGQSVNVIESCVIFVVMVEFDMIETPSSIWLPDTELCSRLRTGGRPLCSHDPDFCPFCTRIAPSHYPQSVRVILNPYREPWLVKL